MPRLLLLMIFTLLIAPAPSQAQENNPAPYLMYYSRALDGWIIERANGTDSRIIGQGLVPEDHNWIDGPGWSPSGEWFAWVSSRKDPQYGGIYESQGYVIRADGTGLREFNPGGTQNNYQDAVIMEWSPVADVLFVIENFRQNDWQGEPVRASLIDMQTGAVLATVDTPIEIAQFGPAVIGWSPTGLHASFYYEFADRDNQIFEHRSVILSIDGQMREDGIVSMPGGMLPTLGWSPDGQAIVFYYFDDNTEYYQIAALFPDGRRVERQVANSNTYTIPAENHNRFFWGPEGWLAMLSSDQTSLILDRFTTGEPVEIPLPPGIIDIEVNWNPIQPIALVAGIHEDNSADLWLLADQTLELVDDSINSANYYPSLFEYWSGLWSPDGQYAVYRSDETTLSLFNLATKTSHTLPSQTEWGPLNVENPVRWSPDSTRLNLEQTDLDTTLLYDLTTQTFTSTNTAVYDYNVFTPDGQGIILNLNSTGMLDKTKMILDIATGEQTLLPVHSEASEGHDIFRWDAEQEWAIDGAIDWCIGHCDFWRAMAVMSRDGTYWREIGTSNFGDAGPNWLPDRVDINKLPPGQSESLTISPVAFDYSQRAWYSDVPYNMRVVCDAEGNASVQNLDSDTLVLTFNQTMSCLENFDTRGTISPDGTLLLLWWDGLQFWRIADAQRVGWIDTQALRIRFSEDGRWLYTTALQAELTWDLNQILRE